MVSDSAIGRGVSSRREEILAVAADLFWQNGYNATTMSELAAALGLRKASLYHHIEGKETLLYELSLDSVARITRAVQEVSEPDSDPTSQLRTLVKAHLVTALSDRSKHATMLTELRSLTTNERSRISELRDAYDQLVEQVIRDGQRSGAFRTDIPPQLLRLALLNMLNWTIFWFRADGQTSMEQLGDIFATLFIEGAGTSADHPRGA
jgi:AcrR family transcriptional regulator